MKKVVFRGKALPKLVQFLATCEGWQVEQIGVDSATVLLPLDAVREIEDNEALIGLYVHSSLSDDVE
jgi:hypothetical protein